MSPDRSSDRRMGRPTMEGYECSGKFYEYSKDYQHRFRSTTFEFHAYLCCIANLEEPSASIEDCCLSAFLDKCKAQLGIPMGASAILNQVNRTVLA